MSLFGMAARRGSIAQIRRSVRTSARAGSDGSAALSWSTAMDGVQCMLEPIATGLAQRLWGQESKATVRAYFPIASGLLPGDGVIITRGQYAGTQYRVDATPLRDFAGASRHIEAGLLLTTETFA